jgi:hypothetical protein
MSAGTAFADLIDRLTAEVLLSLAEVARRLGHLRGKRPVHPSTISRWVTSGRRLSGGRTVRLEAIRVGGQWVTSWPAVQRYLAEQQRPVEAAGPAPAPVRSAGQRRRAGEAAASELERMGC